MNNNVICWFEIYVKDIARAKKFYHAVLGTNFHDMPMPESAGDAKMSFFSAPGDMNETSVSGALIEMRGTKEGDGASVNTMVYFPCMDCSVEEGRVVAAGGRIDRSKFSLGEFGYCSLCLDTEENPFGLFSMT